MSRARRASKLSSEAEGKEIKKNRELTVADGNKKVTEKKHAKPRWPGVRRIEIGTEK